jgi:ATP-binding cassette subfamily B protein
VKFSAKNIKQLLSSTGWALRLIWSTNYLLTLGLVASSLVRGIVPAGVAIVGRGLINAFVDHAGKGAEALEALWPWLALGFGLAIFEAISPLTEKFFTQRLHDDVNLKITGDILDHAARLDVAFFEDPRRREMIERAQQNPADHFINFVRETQAALTNFLQTISLVGILVVIEPWVLLVLAPSALPYLFFQWRLSRRYYLEEYYRTPKRRWTHYFVSLLTNRYSLTEIKLVGLAPFLISQFRLLITQFRDQDRSLHRRSLAGSTIFAAVTTVAFYVIFVRVVLKALAGALTVGDIAIFGGATSRVRFTLERVIQSISSAMEQTLYISNLIDFFNVKPRIRSGSDLVPSTGRGEIEFNDVVFSYPGSKEPTLNGVSLHIEPGEIVALVGENGAGKTTLVKLIARLYDPDTGHIAFDGVDLRRISLDYLHQQMSFVLQDFVRYEATAMDNIAYGDWESMMGKRHDIERVARLAGVDGMIRSMPRGYETMLGRLFGEYDLSGGEWQKLAVARAFSREASVLILDEPTSNLSIQAEYELFCRFRELSRGRTTILVSHRFSTLRMADRILVMERGQIVECGTHQELIANAGRYARLYRLHRRQTSYGSINSINRD